MSPEIPHRRKALPLAQSILWAPGASPGTPAPGDYVLFMHQRALNALHDHLKSSPDKGVLGFLLGHLYEDPPSLQKFAVIELVMRLTVAIYGDKTTVVVSRVWDKMQEELTRSGAQLLGWYHSHPPEGVELAQGDLETHATYFGQPWQSALVIGVGAEGTMGALYRPRGDGSEAGVALPFYELLDPRSVTPDGKKRSSVRWTTYKPHRPPAGVSVVRSGPVPAVSVPERTPPATVSFKPSAPPPPPPPPPPPVPPPVATVPRPPAPQRPLSADLVPPGDTAAAIRSGPMPAVPDAAPPAQPRRRTSRPQPRFLLNEQPRRRSRSGLVLALLALVAAGGGAAWYFLLGPGASSTESPAAVVPDRAAGAPASDSAGRDNGAAGDRAAAVPESVSAAPAPAPALPPAAMPPPTMWAGVDRYADTVIGAIRGYQERARLYEGGLADCTVLARGLIAFEDVWTKYEAEKRQLTVQLDGTRAQRDLLLFSSGDSVSAHYDRSGCRRP